MDPQAPDTNAANTPPPVLEYQPVQRRRSRLTGWDWSLIATVVGFLLLPIMQKATDLGAIKGKVVDWVWLALMTRLLVGVAMRDRSRWWILYLSLCVAANGLVDAVAYYGLRHGW